MILDRVLQLRLLLDIVAQVERRGELVRKARHGCPAGRPERAHAGMALLAQLFRDDGAPALVERAGQDEHPVRALDSSRGLDADGSELRSEVARRRQRLRPGRCEVNKAQSTVALEVPRRSAFSLHHGNAQHTPDVVSGRGPDPFLCGLLSFVRES